METYRTRKLRQLRKWVNGESVHDNEIGECCPDFSCCEPRIETPKEERELFASLFVDEEHEKCHRILMMFLGRAMPLLTDKKVFIAG